MKEILPEYRVLPFIPVNLAIFSPGLTSGKEDHGTLNPAKSNKFVKKSAKKII